MDIDTRSNILKRYLDAAVDMFTKKTVKKPSVQSIRYKKRDYDNKRSLVRSYPGGPTMSRYEENLIREGIVVR